MGYSRMGSTLILLVAASLLLSCERSRAASKGPVKVFILAGQSNMEGQALASTLEPAIADPKTKEHFQHLKKDGEWTKREDVWIMAKFRKKRGSQKLRPRIGPLTVGYGPIKFARDEKGKKFESPAFGPELGFGHVVGNHFQEQVLLIKTAWGGKSVRNDFLPPSAGGPGPYYSKMVGHVKEVLADLKKYFPEYDEKQGAELAGFVWFQGWNDGVGKGNPIYTEQLAHLIRDIRKDLNAPKLPVVIGELGVDGHKPIGWIAKFRKQQAAVAALPEFKDNVRFTKTASYWPGWYKSLDDKYREFKKKNKAFLAEAKKAGQKLSREEIRAFAKKHWLDPNRETLARMSDRRYHYMGCGETYYRIGEAMGKSMLEMLK